MSLKLVIPLIALLLVGPLFAQDDLPLSEPINYDDSVTDDLTQRAFWDWWHIQAAQGDVIVVDMQAREMLEPLLGILDPDGTLVARSDDGTAGGSVSLEYTVQQEGEYTLVATRVGNENGTSDGPYALRVRRANEVPARENAYQEVTFRCQDYEAANAATIEFADDPEQATYYLISVYGLDGFEPVIRVQFSAVDLTDCSRDVQGVSGNRYALPGEDPITLTDPAVYTDHTAQLLITSAAPVGTVTLTIGSANASPGRYLALIEAFTIEPGDEDGIRIGQGPLASALPLTLYMVADSKSRLDPSIHWTNETTAGAICDDAGRRGCEGVPSPEGLAVYIAEQDAEITADRFDAGLVLPPGPPALRDVTLTAFDQRTSGPYALVLMGELPPRS
ncbi:MAG: hypothetical protein K8J31_25185 [Anaerolineae bacterium]|nr:hypothetical protein [Anaerolineae bacterium]